MVLVKQKIVCSCFGWGVSKRKRGFTSIRAEEENLHKRSSPESNKLFHIWLAARLFTKKKKKLFSTLLFCLLAQRKLCPRSDWQLFSPFLPCHQTGALCCVCVHSRIKEICVEFEGLFRSEVQQKENGHFRPSQLNVVNPKFRLKFRTQWPNPSLNVREGYTQCVAAEEIISRPRGRSVLFYINRCVSFGLHFFFFLP